MILSRYCTRQAAWATAGVTLALAGLFLLFDVLDEARDFAAPGATWLRLAAAVLLSQPQHLYEILPIAGLLGTLLALFQMARRAEVLVIRASGVSLLRLALWLSPFGLLLALLTFVVGEMLVPEAESIRDTWLIKGGFRKHALANNVWLRDQNAFIRIGKLFGGGRTFEVQVYRFFPDGQLESFLVAPEARHRDHAWNFKDIILLKKENGKWTRQTQKELILPSGVDGKSLELLAFKPEEMPFFALGRYLDYLQVTGQKTRPFEVARWQKIWNPLFAWAMMLLAVPFAAASSARFKSPRGVLWGSLAGVAFNLGHRAFSQVVLLSSLPPLATVLPLLLCIGATVMLLVLRDHPQQR